MKRIWTSPTIRSAVVYAGAGAGFAIANLILARILPPSEYAVVTLVSALCMVGFALAPAGIDGIVNRRHLEAGPRLLGRVLVATTCTAIVFSLIGALGYGTTLFQTSMIFISTVVGGLMMVASAKFQSEQRYVMSLTLLQSPNLIMLLGAVITVVSGVREAWLPILVMTLGWFPGAIWGWTVLFREREAKPHRSVDFPLGEALAYAGMQATGLLLIQLERLILPHVLPLTDLATYGVLAAIAGSLFRVLQMSVGYTMLPRLRAADSVVARRKLVAQETRTVGLVVLIGSAGIWLVSPIVEHWVLAGKYPLPASLLLAAVVSGIAKVVNSFSKSAASALANQQELAMVNLVGWISVGIAIVAGVAGARWGLAGVIYGVSLGWMVRSAYTMYIAARHLRIPAPESAQQPAAAQ